MLAARLTVFALLAGQALCPPADARDPADLFRSGFENAYQHLLPPDSAPRARAYGIWIPNPLYDTCPKWLHDSYWVYGPDGKVYPTWHPPTDVNPLTGQACTYGHEHGDDPAGAGIAGLSLPFGYVNEVLEATDPAHPRHEDHVGHKVMYRRDLRVGRPGDDLSNFEQTGGSGPVCTFLTKLHQGTHSPVAFTNNMHEVFLHVRCANGVALDWRSMHMFGPGRSFDSHCSGRIGLGTASPSNSPTVENASSRQIGDARCLDRVLEQVAAGQNPSAQWYQFLREDWPTGIIHELRRRDGQFLDNWGQQGADRNGQVLMELSSGLYFVVDQPARYYDATRPNRIGRTVEVCSIPAFRYFNPCFFISDLTANGQVVPWDSPQSMFSGSLRTQHFDWLRLQNGTASSRFYSNAWGTRVRPSPEPEHGVLIEQTVVAPLDGVMYYFGRKDANYRTTGVRAPN